MRPSSNTNPYLIYLAIALAAPLVMFVYLRLDLVCAPRAIVSETICGALALAFLTPAVLRSSKPLYVAALVVPAIMIPLTPVVMFSVLGWDGVVHGHLIAFFTFEAIAVAQVVVISLMLQRQNRCRAA
ncbi:MAG: hypothetical protein JW889_16560 [Verrucomicrobia bacterium]|nr:hypothetical protein [Verrucomicrobiota bacterium]